MVTYADWLNYVQNGIEPQLPSPILESWRRCRQIGFSFDVNELPRLSPDEFRRRKEDVSPFLNRLDDLVHRANLRFPGTITFVDKDFYELYCEFSSPDDNSKLGEIFIGAKLSEEHFGNCGSNLAIRLKVPVTLSSYEHINPHNHVYVSYAEPVFQDGSLIGSLGVHIQESTEVEYARIAAKNVVRLLVEGCLTGQRPIRHRAQPHHGFIAKYKIEDIMYRSAQMADVVSLARQVAPSDHPILIYGESGTGKEYTAQAIHNLSRRKHGPFVSVNCASLSHTLAESELFGYADGAFTGALRGGRPGKIEMANNGTLFLDEVSDLPLEAQGMLLRALQEHEVVRIGDDKLLAVDIRVICATNKDLRQLCVEKAFRWDLYYRLAGITLTLPPLRNRVEDIMVIAESILGQVNLAQGMAKRFSASAVQLLAEYSWPGNIRELRNIVETSHLLSQGELIERETLANLLHIQDFVQETLQVASHSDKKSDFVRLLDETGGKVVEAAKIVGVSRATAYRWLKEVQS